MNTYRFTYRMEVYIDAETEEKAQEIYDNCNINEEYNPEYIEQVSIDLWEENIYPAPAETTLEIPAENLDKYDFKLFYIKKGSVIVYTFTSYEEALDKLKEVNEFYYQSDRFTMDGRTENDMFAIHYIYEGEIKNYSFRPIKK